MDLSGKEKKRNMDLLEFGLENQDSKSPLKKAAAKGALAAVRAQADLYEKYIERKNIPVPDDLEENEKMLEKIRKEIQKK